MNHKEFEDSFNTQVDRSMNILIGKSKEYATNSDRLHNFHKAAAMSGGTPEKALWGMIMKHLVSLSDMCLSDDPDSYSIDMWDEKINDSINYLFLLRGIRDERNTNGPE